MHAHQENTSAAASFCSNPQTFSHKRPRRTIMVELILNIIIDILFS